jgi:protein ImuB
MSLELYACLRVPEFPAQSLLRLQPELRMLPCVVMDGNRPEQWVCSINTKARLLGVVHGMTRVEVETFPGVHVFERSRKVEAATENVLLQCVGAFSPRMEILHEVGSFACAADIAGNDRLFGSPESMTRKLLQHINGLQITGCVGISRNLYAALCAAKSVLQGGAIRRIAGGQEATFLASLPLSVLPLSILPLFAPRRDLFNLWGIHTLGALAALPEKELVARLGQEGKRLRQLALGELPHTFQPSEPAFVLQEHLELDSPVEALESLLFAAGVMLDQLILRAKARILALASVTITLSLDGAATFVRTVRPAVPGNDKLLWIKLLHLDLEAHPPGAAILAIDLHAEPGGPSKIQSGLFSPQLPEAARLDVTLARLRSLVGEGNVGQAVLLDTHAAINFRVEPFTLPLNKPTALKPSAGHAHSTRVAVRQVRPPEAITTSFSNGKLSQFRFRSRSYRVEQIYGPWRTSGDWWNPEMWSFEQWDVAARCDESLLFCCLAKDRIRGQWNMTALYD